MGKIKNLILFLSAGGLLLGGVLAIWAANLKIPDLAGFEERRVAESTKIYDRSGEVLLFDVFQNIRRTVVPFEEISENIKLATLAIEDTRFFKHRGVELRSIVRAILVNFGSLKWSQGGSTITQQVVKNSLLSSEKRISRKIKEWILALKLEKVLSKEEIFALYLNEVPYGGNLYGVEEASQAFFGKSAKEVSLAEAAYLAAMPKAPTFYSPYRNREELENRKNLVLREMRRYDFIDQEKYEAALAERVEFQDRGERGIKAPHFVMFVREVLEKKYGREVLERGGLRVITTLNYDWQKKAEELAKKYAAENQKKFNAENLALVAIEPQSGQILSMVGSRDYFDREIEGQFNVATARRQPGSAFKPFAYAAAFNKGYTPETVLFDLPTVFTAHCPPEAIEADCYRPQNYDNRFRGPISMREALAQSINVPSVKVLYLAGVQNTINLAKDAGIQGLLDPTRYGLTLVLGGGEVSLLDLVSAYGTFANEGRQVPYQAIIEIRDKDGQVLERPLSLGRPVLPAETARQISDILSDNAARAPIFGENSLLNIPGRPVAVKTGTTNDYRDAWIVGYAPNLAVGAWAGNNDNRPMEKRIAGLIITPFWREFIDSVLPTLPVENFNKPPGPLPLTAKPVLRGKWQGGRTVLLDRISGKLATEYTPPETWQEILVGEIRTILYWVDKDNPQGPAPIFPEADPQFRNWDWPIQKWLSEQGLRPLSEEELPEEYDDIHRPEFFPQLTIQSPAAGQTLPANQLIKARFSVSGRFPVSRAEFFLNNVYLGSADQTSGLDFSFLPAELDFAEDSNVLRIVIWDSVFNKAEAETEFYLNNLGQPGLGQSAERPFNANP